MGRAPCCDKANVKKGPWSPEEDAKLKEYIDKNGTGGNWITLPQKAGLKRCGKSCRLRWLNYLRPNIKHGEFSDKEDRIICTLFSSIGSRWSIIAGQLPGRTDNDIKNYWNTKLKKKLMGLMPSNNYSSSQKTPLHVINCYPSPPPSSSSSPLSVADVANYDQISIPSNSTVIRCHDYEGYVGHMGNIYQVKESALMFGGGTEASCSTEASSGGSLSTQSQSYLFNNGVDHHENYQNLMISNCGYYEKPDGLCVESGVEYSSLEEIKQLISTNFCNFLVDENKAEENVVYF